MNLLKSLANTITTALTVVDTSVRVVNDSLVPVGQTVVNVAKSTESLSNSGLVLVQSVEQGIQFTSDVEVNLYANPEFAKLETKRIIAERAEDMEITTEELASIINYKPEAQSETSAQSA